MQFLKVVNCFKGGVRNMSHSSKLLKLSNYDCIGFDLDYTLCLYNLNEVCNLEYNLMKNRLIELGYDEKDLSKPLVDNVDFIRRGLILDIEKGNILDVSYDGTIVKASHGTNMLTDEQITSIYGCNRRWYVTDMFSQEPLSTWEGPLAEKLRPVLDYFDIIVPLVYGRAINCVDSKNDNFVTDYTYVWKDILDTLHHMYFKEHFNKNLGGYYEAIKTDPCRYVKKRPPEFLNWLKKIKEKKITFLITGSDVNYASLVAETSLGKEWKTFFDVIVFFARKPGFFIGNRQFFKIVDQEQESSEQMNDLQCKLYSQGNWDKLYNFLKLKTTKDNPLCLYMGDNLLQDIYAPTRCLHLDTVAVVREIYDEKLFRNTSTSNCEEMITSSSLWGSYFKTESEDKLTIWGEIIRSCSKTCVPDLCVFVNNPIDYAYDTVDINHINYNMKELYPAELNSHLNHS